MKEKRSFIKKIGSFFSTIFLLVLIPYFIISVVLVYSNLVNLNINENHIPTFFGFKPVIIHDNAMKGDLDKGDLLIIKEQEDYTQLNTGTIITYSQKKDEYQTKKIYRVLFKPEPPEKGETTTKPAEYNTKANKNKKVDEARLFSDDIEGVYLLRIPYIGTYLSYIEHEWLLVFSLPILAIVIILFIKLKIKCAAKKIKEDNKVEQQDLELFSAAELTSGKELRKDLLNSKLGENKEVSSNPVQQPTVVPTPQEVPQPTVTPVQDNNQLTGGIKIVPPTETQINQNTVTQQPQTQSQPQVIPVTDQVKVVPLNNNQENK